MSRTDEGMAFGYMASTIRLSFDGKGPKQCVELDHNGEGMKEKKEAQPPNLLNASITNAILLASDLCLSLLAILGWSLA